MERHSNRTRYIWITVGLVALAAIIVLMLYAGGGGGATGGGY